MIKTHDDYIAQAAQPLRQALVELRDQLRKILPDADEIIAYNMPGFNVGKDTVVGYAAFSKQCGVYLNPKAISAFSDELEAAGFKPTKTGIKFTPEKPIPEELLNKLVLFSQDPH